MKKNLLILLTLILAFSFPLKAQVYVSTDPDTRNVLIEEFSDRYCSYCPEGDMVANQIENTYLAKVWTVSYHDETSVDYPNLSTGFSANLFKIFYYSLAFPRALVNRSTELLQDRDVWDSLTVARLNEIAECNVAGVVNIDEESRIATIAVEVYYTANSLSETNYLNVIMVQDNILGYQAGGNSNPSQYNNGNYCHKGVFRDFVKGTGNYIAINSTTEGSLITRTFRYPIPEIIGDTNGVAVDLNNIRFLAFVGEKDQPLHVPTYYPIPIEHPLLNVCELERTFDTPYDITATASQEGGGTISGTGSFFEGLQCTLKAEPKPGWVFTAWTENDTIVSTDPELTFIVTGNRNLIAVFRKKVGITVASNIPGGAILTGTGEYLCGDTATVTATPKPNYSFINWSIDDEIVSTDSVYTFVVTRGCIIYANLISHIGVDEQTIRISASPNPFSDILTVEADEAIVAIEIYNMKGAMVYSQKNLSAKAHIPAHNLPSGQYLLHLTTRNGSATIKVIRE